LESFADTEINSNKLLILQYLQGWTGIKNNNSKLWIIFWHQVFYS